MANEEFKKIPTWFQITQKTELFKCNFKINAYLVWIWACSYNKLVAFKMPRKTNFVMDDEDPPETQEMEVASTDGEIVGNID